MLLLYFPRLALDRVGSGVVGGAGACASCCRYGHGPSSLLALFGAERRPGRRDMLSLSLDRSTRSRGEPAPRGHRGHCSLPLYSSLPLPPLDPLSSLVRVLLLVLTVRHVSSLQFCVPESLLDS